MINVFGHINIYSFWNAEESIQKPKHKNRLRENISGHTEKNMGYDETDFVHRTFCGGDVPSAQQDSHCRCGPCDWGTEFQILLN